MTSNLRTRRAGVPASWLDWVVCWEKRKGNKGVSVTYDQIGNTTDGLSYVELNLDGAGKGDHEVQVTVEDLVSGVQVRKKTTFGIR